MGRGAHVLSSSDSDTELASKIENHMGDLQALKTEREGFKQKLGDETDSLAAFERKRSQAQTAHGRLLAQKQVRLYRSSFVFASS